MSFKDKYKDSWATSTKREQAVKDLLATHDIILEKFGFEAESTSYNPGYAAEQGIPDYKVTGQEKYVEVTGTDSTRVKPEDPIWIRPDKVNYAINHPDKKIIMVHVIDYLKLFRYIPVLLCRSCPVMPRLGDEHFHIVPAYRMKPLKMKDLNG